MKYLINVINFIIAIKASNRFIAFASLIQLFSILPLGSYLHSFASITVHLDFLHYRSAINFLRYQNTWIPNLQHHLGLLLDHSPLPPRRPSLLLVLSILRKFLDYSKTSY